MPRRRSHGLTFSATLCGICVAAVAGTVGTRRRRMSGGADRQRLPDHAPGRPARHDAAGAAPRRATRSRRHRRPSSSARTGRRCSWLTIAADGTVGGEQSVALPDGTIRSWNALAGVDAPGDHVIIGVLVPAANGSDAELRLISAPADGGPAGDSGRAHRDVRRRGHHAAPDRDGDLGLRDVRGRRLDRRRAGADVRLRRRAGPAGRRPGARSRPRPVRATAASASAPARQS